MSFVSGSVGVVGLGNMGLAMASNLVKNGFDVVGTDLIAENRADLTKPVARQSPTPARSE